MPRNTNNLSTLRAAFTSTAFSRVAFTLSALTLALVVGGCASSNSPFANTANSNASNSQPSYQSTSQNARPNTNFASHSGTASNPSAFATNSGYPTNSNGFNTNSSANPANSPASTFQPLPGDALWRPLPTVTSNVGIPETPAPLANTTELLGNGNVESTSNVVRVTNAEVGAAFDPTLAPDGKSLIFASTQHRRTSDIYLQRIGSRVVTQLTSDPADDAMPQVSPDGTRVAFSSNRNGNWDIYIMPIGGGRAVQVTNDPADEIAPSWSPDGAQMVFSRLGEASGRWEMWVTQGRDHTVSSFIGFGLFPRWCPLPATGFDGADKIAFQVGRERDTRGYAIWTLDYFNGTATNLTEIASSAEQAMINPNWSPDGNWLVFAQRPLAGTAQNTSLWMVGVDGAGRVRLSGDQSRSLSPVWAANNRLYFVSNRNGLDNIWGVDLGQALAAAKALTPPVGFVAKNGGSNVYRQADTAHANPQGDSSTNPVAQHWADHGLTNQQPTADAAASHGEP